MQALFNIDTLWMDISWHLYMHTPSSVAGTYKCWSAMSASILWKPDKNEAVSSYDDYYIFLCTLNTVENKEIINMLTFNCGSNYEIFVQYKTKTNKKVRRFHNIFVNFQNFTNIK